MMSFTDNQMKISLKTAPKWVEVLLVLSAAWVVAGFFVGTSVQLTGFIAQDSANKRSENSDIDVSKLSNVALFGEAPAVGAVAVQKPQPQVTAPSRLNITLIGTVVAGGKSAAVVKKDKGSEQEVFVLGQALQPGVVLLEVTAIDIVVDNHGKRERIVIEGEDALVSATPVQQVLPTAQVQPRRPAINKQVNRGYIQEKIRNFSTLLSQARVTPHFTDNKPDGFTISEIVKGSMYEDMGLLDGDVIQKVNGEEVTGAEQAMRMYRELQSATFIDIEVQRNGTVQQISYTIQ